MSKEVKLVDLFRTLTEEEKQELKEALKGEFTLCEVKGHNYRYIGKKEFWLWRPKDRFICTRCGEELLK